MLVDRFGHEISGDAASVSAWNDAWEQFLHFDGDPIATLTPQIDSDDAFVMGPVFVAAYLVLAGSPFDSPALGASLDRVRSTAASENERGHLRALELLVAGDFAKAAHVWDALARSAHDFAAVRIAHDIYLHVGDAAGRLASSGRAAAEWTLGEPGANFVAGQYAFALEETGRFVEAERVGRLALDADPDDLWARHALAHVYESTNDQTAALNLLEGSVERWSKQDSLAVHIWWHLGLRYFAAGDTERVLDIVDRIVDDATTAFRLCDVTSLLWRLELTGASVGERWDLVVDRWSDVAERHACAFIDVHAVMAFSRQPEHVGATTWRSGLEQAETGRQCENAEIFRKVVRPLALAIDHYARNEHAAAAAAFDALEPQLHRIGGSIAQRDVVTLTRQRTGDHS